MIKRKNNKNIKEHHKTNKNNLEREIIVEKKHQLEDLKYLIKEYNLVTLNGEFGVGKTWLKEELLKDETFRKEYLVLEINAYTDNNRLLDIFFEKLILKNKKIKPFCYKNSFINPNINSWFGKFIFNFSKVIPIILAIFTAIPAVLGVSLKILQQYQNNSSTLIKILAGISITFFLFMIFSIVYSIKLKDNKVNNLYLLKKRKYNLLKSRNKTIIFIIEDLNRLDSEEQKDFLQNFLSFRDIIDKNMKCLFLSDYNLLSKNDWSKYFDFDFLITNSFKTMGSVFFLELEKKDINWKLIEENIDDKYELKSILNLIFNQKNIRLLKLFIKKLEMYKDLISNIKIIKFNILDLFSYLYLSVYENQIYSYINNNPRIILYNNLKIPEEKNNKDEKNWFSKNNYDIEWTNLIKPIEEESKNNYWNNYNYSEIRQNLLPLTSGILRFQTKEYSTIYRKVEKKSQINITDEEYFHFYKSPQHYKDFIRIYKNFIQIINKHNLDNKSIIQTIIDYAENFNEFFGLKTFDIFAKLVFSFYKNKDSKKYFNCLKNEILSILIKYEKQSFSFINQDIYKISNSFKQIFRDEISEDINVLKIKYNLKEYIDEKPTNLLDINNKTLNFIINIKDEETKKDFKWLSILSNIFFQDEIFDVTNNIISDENLKEELQIYYLFYSYNFFIKKSNQNVEKQVENIINYERKNNQSNEDFIYELMLYDINYPFRIFLFFSDENLEILGEILNSKNKSEKGKIITEIIINSNKKNLYDFYYGDRKNPFWLNDEAIWNDLKKQNNNFNYWLIKNHKDKFELNL